MAESVAFAGFQSYLLTRWVSISASRLVLVRSGSRFPAGESARLWESKASGLLPELEGSMLPAVLGD